MNPVRFRQHVFVSNAERQKVVSFLQSIRIFKSTFSIQNVINLLFIFLCCVFAWLHPEIWEGASGRHREVCWSHKMTVLESVYGLSSLSRHHHWSAPSNYSAEKMLSIFSALNPLLAHTHTEHTSLVLGFSMYIGTFEMHKQPMLPPVTTHMISERKMEMEGFGHPSAAVKENMWLNRPRAYTQHHISEQRKPQTLCLAVMRHGSGLQLHLIW